MKLILTDWLSTTVFLKCRANFGWKANVGKGTIAPSYTRIVSWPLVLISCRIFLRVSFAAFCTDGHSLHG